MTEQDWIEYLRGFLPVDERIVASAEEDCAIIKLSTDRHLLLTTDALVEGIHFKLDYFTFFDLGYKLAAVNLSDIAAMGGSPIYALLTLGSNRPLEKDWLIPLLEGIRCGLSKYGACLVGGDTVRSEVFFLNLALVGEAERPVLRSTAKPKDLLFVSRALGASSAFLRLSQSVPLTEIPEDLKQAHLRPEPEVTLAKELSKLVSSMIDVSDGLLLDLYRLCKPSNVGAIVDLEKVPVACGATQNEALTGGEDFALLFSIPIDRLKLLKEVEQRLGRELFEIGEIIEGQGLYLRDKRGLTEVAPSGYDHFSSPLQP